ncbi:hypothetical protein GCM10009625_35340 [Brachybacterium fresconis]
MVVGLLLLAYTLWSRHGGSPPARHWIAPPPAENWMLERIVVLGAPAIGLALIDVAAILVLEGFPVLRGLAVGVLIVLLIPVLYFVLAVIPLPLVLYPRWAREVVRRRRRYWREFRARQRV